jgi:BCD family chlorophyll transporter-like MFS transporter
MIRPSGMAVRAIKRFGPRLLPFADAATAELPLGRLLRLGLFQITVGMAVVLLNGTLNRVMIVELGVQAWLVALMVSLPLVFAPLRALIGFKSDTHRSFLGWRRVPYIWFGSMLQFGGFAIMPFALLILSGDAVNAPGWLGPASAALAFLLVGAGLHTVQTAGLALATDIAPADARPRVVALLYVMLLVGMVASSLAFGWLLDEFGNVRLIQVIQGAAVFTIVVNTVALWRQEPRNAALTDPSRRRPRFAEAWGEFRRAGRTGRVLAAIGLGTAGFSMQDILLEPYGGQVLGLSVGATTALTALQAGGMLAGFAFAARRLGQGTDPYRLAATGALVGIAAFSVVVFSEPLGSALMFRIGVAMIGLGSGLFAVGTLTAAMGLAREGASGIALGAWGAVQATAAGVAIFAGGLIRDVVGAAAASGALGPALADPAVGYVAVYHLEILILFAALVAIGPLAGGETRERTPSRFGLAEFPG